MSEEKVWRIGNNARDGAEDFDFKVLTNKLIEVINAGNGGE